MTQLRVRRAAQPLTDQWQRVPVQPRGNTQLGISFRPLQAEALGLDPQAALQALLRYPFDVIRIAAYWDRLETAPGRFETGELDRVLDAAEQAGKQVILGVGAVKNFGYPEFFVPAHHLDRPLPEGVLITPQRQRGLLEAATAFLSCVTSRYADRNAIVAWQVEHEAVDPLGMEHSWRLSEAFVRAEVEAVRAADPRSRPVMMNGFLPTSTPVALQQRWRTRDQGDSLAVAQRLADIIGVDCYPRHALASAGPLSVYLDGSQTRSRQRQLRLMLDHAAAAGRRLMIAEGQAEPWEAVTTPPNPAGLAMYSCRPEDLITTYSRLLRLASERRRVLGGYLFWGAEYWLARDRQGDDGYLRAFERVLHESVTHRVRSR
jgi:Beta-galactosidase